MKRLRVPDDVQRILREANDRRPVVEVDRITVRECAFFSADTARILQWLAYG